MFIASISGRELGLSKTRALEVPRLRITETSMVATERRTPNSIDSQSALGVWLDTFRWLAATAVVLTHMNEMFFVKVASLPPEARTYPHMALAVFSGFGRPAVIIFFVLSGFLVGGGSLNKYARSGRFDFIDYLIARFVRLWLVLLPAMIYIIGINAIGLRLIDHETGPYEILGSIGFNLNSILSQFLSNALFLPDSIAFGDDNPLWSLVNEFWYYIFWALILLFCTKNNKTSWSIALIALIVAVFSYVGYSRLEPRNNIDLYFSIWLLGVYAGIGRAWVFSSNSPAAGCVCAIILIGWRLLTPPQSDVSFPTQFALDAIVALAFANLLIAMRAREPHLVFPPFRAWNKLAAGFSFSLYVIHFPTLHLICAVALAFTGSGYHIRPMNWLHYTYGFGAVALCMLAAYLFSLATESHTNSVKRFVCRLTELARVA